MPSPRSIAQLRLSLASLLLTGCPDDATAGAEASTDTTSTGRTTTGGDTDFETTAAPAATTGSTTAVVDDTGTGTDGTTGEPPPQGTCVGLTEIGHIGLVLARDAMPIETTCDPAPAQCGGDPVGGWTLDALCGFEATPNPFEDECPDSEYEVEILSQGGTMTFEDDGTFVQDLDVVAQTMLMLNPLECFGLSCLELEDLLRMQTTTPMATCQEMGPHCECMLPDDGVPEQAMGRWEAVNAELRFTAEGLTVTFPYCVTGARLELWQPIHDMPISTAVPCTNQQDCIDSLGVMYDFYVCTANDASAVVGARESEMRTRPYTKGPKTLP
jgi:hypothetical protein